MRYQGAESEHPKPTRFYNYWTLLVLSDASEPLHLKTIYSRVRTHLENKRRIRERDDLEYWIRWSLSNAQAKGYVNNTSPGEGEWQITEKGQNSLAVPIDDDDIVSDI